MKSTSNSKKTTRILIGIVILLLAILVGLVSVQLIFGKDDYYAVYLRTGDLYFGKLVRFPYFGMKNVYTLQATQDPQNPLRIQKFSEIFWGPSDYLKLNRDEIVWYTKLNSQGQLYKVLTTNPNLIPPQQQTQQIQQQPTQEEQTQEQQTTTTEKKAAEE